MVAQKESYAVRAGTCVREGVRRGLRTTLWLLKFMVPVSFCVAVLHWSGILGMLAHWLGPVFRHLGLPGETAIVFVTGALLNVYSAMGAMAAIPLTTREITILGLMVLMSHNLPIEMTVQHKAGSSGLRMLLLRLTASAVGAFVLNLLLPHGGEAVAAQSVAATETVGFVTAMTSWATGTLWLAGKVMLFIMGVMVLQRFLDEFGIMPWLARILALPLAFLGLPPATVFLWIVANTLGLAYGAGIMIEEVRLGKLTKDEAEIINHSVAVCHSLLEDTLLVMAVGAMVFWITIPRLILAAAAVWAYRAWRRFAPVTVAEGEATARN